MSDGPNTRLVHAGRRREWTHTGKRGIVNPPIWRASTVLFDTLAELEASNAAPDEGLNYGARGTPTSWSLEEALSELDPGAAGTRLYPTGLAALAVALMTVLSAGDHVLITDSTYDPTRLFADRVLTRMGIEVSYYDPLIGSGIAALVRPNTRACVVESPGSLTFEVQDIPAIVAVCKAHGIATILDNTWATPLLFPSMAFGIDLSMQALTKYVGGHADVLIGSVTASPEWWPRLSDTTRRFGQYVSPDDCALALRGLRTMALRLKQHEIERAGSGALVAGPPGGRAGVASGAARRSGSCPVAARLQGRERPVRLRAAAGQPRRHRRVDRRPAPFRYRLQLGRLRKPDPADQPQPGSDRAQAGDARTAAPRPYRAGGSG